MNYRNRQAGGTILGIIIGLIIGLGIAVGVAMTINKVPVPFVNRNARTEKPVETAPSQSVDLNKSLYGNREPAKEAAKEFVKEADPAAAAKTADKSADKADAKADDKAKKPDAKNADAKDAKDAAGDDKWTYYLQAGAFREQADAENTKAKLALLGFETRISERTADTGTMYRVRVGPFSQVDAMNKVRSKLSDNGVDVSVVRIPK